MAGQYCMLALNTHNDVIFWQMNKWLHGDVNTILNTLTIYAATLLLTLFTYYASQHAMRVGHNVISY